MDVINHEVEGRKEEQKHILADMAQYQSKLGTLPIREQEMAGLTRDYEITKTNYRSLLDKKIAAEMATDMERREKSERFTIIDPARVPSRPFKPNRQLFGLAGSILGLAIGLALGLGKEFHQGAFLGEWELPPGVVLLGRLPRIEMTAAPVESAADGPRGGRRARFFWIVSSAAALLLLAVLLGKRFALLRL